MKLKLKSLLAKRFLFRAWFLFRTGYSTYWTFPFSAFGTLVSIYYLAVNSIPSLKAVFPTFTVFSVVAVVVGIPLCVGAGQFHYKRSAAYSSEADITIESNPYNYRAVPGHQQLATFPALLMIVRQMRRLSEQSRTLAPTDQKQMLELESILQKLINGGSVGRR